MTSTTSSQGALVELRDIRFGYGERVILDGISLTVPRGKVTALMGASGGGKTTIGALIPRFYSPDAGCIRVDGHDIAKVDLYSLRAQIGVVPQDSLLFDGTVLSNIALTRPDAGFEEVCLASQIACEGAMRTGFDPEKKPSYEKPSNDTLRYVASAAAPASPMTTRTGSPSQMWPGPCQAPCLRVSV